MLRLLKGELNDISIRNSGSQILLSVNYFQSTTFSQLLSVNCYQSTADALHPLKELDLMRAQVIENNRQHEEEVTTPPFILPSSPLSPVPSLPLLLPPPSSPHEVSLSKNPT